MASTVSFPAHVALVDRLIDAQGTIVDRIERTLLNVQGKDILRRRDRRVFEQTLLSSVFGAPGISPDAIRLKDQLLAAHMADGFEPMAIEPFPNELDPVDLLGRAHQQWDRTRWPGKSGRLTFARALLAVLLLRRLEYLSLRIWDDDEASASARLRDVQRLLDRLSAGDSGPFVRDARWLIQTAQGPVTRGVAAYFGVAARVEQLDADDRLETHRSGAVLAGGHLRSQLRYTAARIELPADHPQTLAATRNSNSMDNALLVRDLAGLLEAYEIAASGGDDVVRARMSDAILQGLSADPDLLVTRLDLLVPYTAVEDVPASRDGALHERYAALLGRVSGWLLTDALAFDPRKTTYSPYAVTYGFVADVFANMAMEAAGSPPAWLQPGRSPGAENALSLEDMFDSRDRGGEKLARARVWEGLARSDREQAHFTHTADWAQAMFTRLTHALEERMARPDAPNASGHPTTRIFLRASTPAGDAMTGPAEADNANEQCFTSDARLAVAVGMTAWPRQQMVEDRREGRFLASAEADGEWFGVSKFILTVCLAQAQDAVLRGLPPVVETALRATCSGLVAPAPGIALS